MRLTQRQVNKFRSYSDLCRHMNIPINGNNIAKMRRLCMDLDTSHFSRGRKKRKKSKGRKESAKYRAICFEAHGKSCWVCGESFVVEVHHVDRNKKNNVPENLAPLCPTHHRYYHIPELRNQVEPIIIQKLASFSNTHTV